MEYLCGDRVFIVIYDRIMSWNKAMSVLYLETVDVFTLVLF